MIMNVVVIVSRQTSCSSSDCKNNFCRSTCSCLGFLVDCSRRGLIDVPKDLPNWVQILDLQNNDISSIAESSFERLRNLTEMDLSNNQLRQLNLSNLLQLSYFQKLKIHHNHLIDIPELGYHQSLSILSLQHNEIPALNVSILEKFPNLHTLDLSFNSIVDIPVNTFGNSSSLLHLSLSHNRIVTIEKGTFDNLTVLESLKLNKNKLTAIPKELFKHLNSLKHLELNANSLSHIEGLSFQGLMSLVVLKLRHSSITHLLDGAFYGLNAIKKLQLDYNNISKVTKGWLYGLNSLQRLYLSHNVISHIEEDAWDSGKRLLELDMSNNQLQSISAKTFDKLYSLKRLILSNNMITYIEEDAFRSLSALQFLELKNNEVAWTIEDTGKIFAGLHRLKFLGLANNKIKGIIKRAFTGIPKLETLNLTSNELTTIEENAFDGILNLKELLINSSSLVCDCNLRWLRDFQYPIAARCGYPEKLKGLSVFAVPRHNFVCEGSPKPVIIKEPHTKITLKGGNVTLECQATSSSSAHAKCLWRKDGKLLWDVRLRVNSTSIKIANYTLHTSTLLINNIQDKDEGRYQCIISNRFGSAYSNKAHITVHVFPVFTKTPKDVAVKAGSLATLECGARGQPVPKISLRKDGGDDFPAATERRLHVMPDDHIFYIVGIKQSDTGVYSCTAQNVAGVIMANATLTVLEKPAFVKKMSDKESRVGETAVLECLASGSPKPKLTWVKDGGPLQVTERHFFTAGSQILIIVNSQISDSGHYMCEMSNTLGTERGSSHLKILPALLNDDGLDEDPNTTGVVIIAIVCCIVGTSIVWVAVIYTTRKRVVECAPAASNDMNCPPDQGTYGAYPTVYPNELTQSVTNMYLDSHSGHSKDSGTGDSGQPSSDNLLMEDDQGPLLDHHPARHSAVPANSSFIGLEGSVGSSETSCEPFLSPKSLSKEQAPLLSSFRTSRSPWKNCKMLNGATHQQPEFDACRRYPLSGIEVSQWPAVLAQRSFSAEHITNNNTPLLRGSSEPPETSAVVRADSDGIGRDSGFSTIPRSITQTSVSNWSSGSPRLHRLPKDIPNDSGSFSIGSEDVQPPLSLVTRCHSVTVLPTHPTSHKSNSTTIREQKV